MDFTTGLPEGDIGQFLRELGRHQTRRAQRDSLRGPGARMKGGGGIPRRPAVPRARARARIPTRPRNLSAPRTWSSMRRSRSSSRFSPQAERRFNTDVFGMRAVDDLDSGLRRLENDPDSIIVAVHGISCSVRGGVVAGYGVFFSGLADPLNRSGPVPYLAEQTTDFAEIFAAMQALEVINSLIASGQDISHVVIKTNSEFLAKAMVDLVWIWAGRDFNNTRGQPLTNGRPIKLLHEKVQLLEKNFGVRVSFCKVQELFNEQAVALAQEAMRRL